MLPGFIRLADYMLVEGLMLLAVGTGSSLRIRLKLEPRLLSSVRSCTQCHALITCHLKFTCMPMPMPMPTTTPTFNQAYINAHALIHPRSRAHNKQKYNFNNTQWRNSWIHFKLRRRMAFLRWVKNVQMLPRLSGVIFKAGPPTATLDLQFFLPPIRWHSPWSTSKARSALFSAQKRYVLWGSRQLPLFRRRDVIMM